MAIHDPAALLLDMIDGLTPYDSRIAHDAAMKLVGGSQDALACGAQLVDLAFQMEGLALAESAAQSAGIVATYRAHAHVALTALRHSKPDDQGPALPSDC